MDRHAIKVRQQAGGLDAVGSTGVVRMQQGQKFGAGDVEPDGPLAQAVGRLVHVDDVGVPQLGEDSGEEPGEAVGPFGVHRVEEPSGNPDTEQVGHRLFGPFEGQVLAAQQVERGRPDPWSVAGVSPGRGGEGGLGHRPTRTPLRLGPVLDGEHHRDRDVGHLADLGALSGDVGQICAAAITRMRSVEMYVVGIVDVCEVLAVGTRLLARLAAQGPSCGTVGVLRSVLLAPEQVRGRRKRRVVRVLPHPLLQRRDLPGERLDLRAQRHVLAAQPLDPACKPVNLTTQPIVLGTDIAHVLFRTGCHAEIQATASTFRESRGQRPFPANLIIGGRWWARRRMAYRTGEWLQ